MPTSTPARYRRRSDGLEVEALQNTPDTEIWDWVPPNLWRADDPNAGVPALYIFTINGGQERVWLNNWVVRHPDGRFEIVGNVRFTDEFEAAEHVITPTDEQQHVLSQAQAHIESAAPIGEPLKSGESVDLEEEGQMLAALAEAVGTANGTADFWTKVADTLSAYRSLGVNLPETPYGHEEWYEKSPVRMPFDLDEMRAELTALSPLITKAHTIAALYRREARRLDDEYAAVAPD
ncbi:hypothetical protein [Nocardia sp. SC052]|uniref:hypothetical protein n=1 Tax=Nocardia sichangensis TaxID=3385975 RepID=UPI0039A0BB13